MARAVAPKVTATPVVEQESASDLEAEEAPDPPVRRHRRRGAFSAEDRVSFAELERSLGGRIGLAATSLGRGGRVWSMGSLDTAVAWSTSKLPVAMAVIDAGQAAAQQQALTAAITASDNAAAAQLWQVLGGGEAAAQAADAELRAAGDNQTQIESRTLRPEFSAFGQTDWALSNQARFAAGLTCTSSGAQVFELMGQVISSQRWGLGSIDGTAALKGGWGPGSRPGTNGGYLDRQLGVVTIGGRPIAAAIAAEPADGSHETATSQLSTVAAWLRDHVNAKRFPSQARC